VAAAVAFLPMAAWYPADLAPAMRHEGEGPRGVVGESDYDGIDPPKARTNL